jgi:hypothetical protein
MPLDTPQAGRKETSRDVHVYFDIEDPRDAAIVAWLQTMLPRRRQDALRTALYTYVQEHVTPVPPPPASQTPRTGDPPSGKPAGSSGPVDRFDL